MTIKKLFNIEKSNKNEWLKLDIQTFADDGGNGGQDDDQTPPETITLTPEELAKQVESESDRKFEANKKKWEAAQKDSVQQQIKDALEEKERLSKLSEKERKEEELSSREKELANRLAEIERKELKADAVTDLTSKQLPTSFADFLLADDAEKTLANINEFKTAFDAAVSEAVKEKLRQDTPSAGGGGIAKSKATSVAALAQEHRLIK